jgi:uncharacterized protein YjbI with pentapeptide repeats
MNDETRQALDDAETPVNPYSLLAAVNASSRSANRAWIVFLALLAYLSLAVASVTHRDLLLNADIVLPLLQVKLGLTRFFLIVPVLVVIAHAGLILQLALLARRAIEFNAALKLLESTDERSHPLRLEVDNFFLVQAIAGPERSRVMSAFLNAVGWLTLAILPLLLLLYVQMAFLPFHDAAITMAHRLIVLADILLLVLLGLFVMRAEATYFGALWRTAVHNPGSLVFAIAVLAAAAFASVYATVPGHGAREERAGLLTGADGTLFGLFPRNLVVTDADLVRDGVLAVGARSVSLRGRDLRFARLDRSDLHQADLTGANLDGASLAGADLRHVMLRCDERTDLSRRENRDAQPCASARGASFVGARLGGAKLGGLDLQAARFDGARLEGADLSNAQLGAADFSRAELPGADLSNTTAPGATFQSANLQGTDLTGAKLQMADLSGAALEAAALVRANLEGASLRDAALDGAVLGMARLFGADLGGARLNAADLSGAMLWRTQPPSADAGASADLTNLAMRPPTEEDVDRMRTAVERLEAGPAKVRLAALVAPVSETPPGASWTGSPEGQAWAALVKASETAVADGYRARLTEQLGRLACRPRFSDGAVAGGLARRAAAQGFKGDPAAFYDRLRAADCPTAATLPRRALRDLAAAADAARGQ